MWLFNNHAHSDSENPAGFRLRHVGFATKPHLALIHYRSEVLRILGVEISCGCTHAIITHDY